MEVEVKPLGMNSVLHFGKHRDQTVREVLDEDPTYINWLADQDFRFTQDVWEAMIDDEDGDDEWANSLHWSEV